MDGPPDCPYRYIANVSIIPFIKLVALKTKLPKQLNSMKSSPKRWERKEGGGFDGKWTNKRWGQAVSRNSCHAIHP
jgi:hypothetical protein